MKRRDFLKRVSAGAALAATGGTLASLPAVPVKPTMIRWRALPTIGNSFTSHGAYGEGITQGFEEALESFLESVKKQNPLLPPAEVIENYALEGAKLGGL